MQARILPELFLELADDSGLDFVKIFQLSERHEYYDRLLATIKLDLLRRRYVQSM